MTGEEMERAMEFLLQSQANSEARITRLEAAHGETNHQIGDLVSAQQRTQQQLDQVVNIVAELVEWRRSIRDDAGALVRIVGGLVEGRGGGTYQGGEG